MEASPFLQPPSERLTKHNGNSIITEHSVADSMTYNNRSPPTEKSALGDVNSNVDTPPKDNVTLVSKAGSNSPQALADGPSAEVHGEHANSTAQSTGLEITPQVGMTSGTDMPRPLQGQGGAERRRMSSSGICAMCHNYEHQLQTVQLLQQENKKQLVNAMSELAEKNQRLEDVTSRHAELESILEVRVASQQAKLLQLEDRMKHMTTRFESLISNYRQHRKTTETEIGQLQRACEVEQADFQLLQSHYDSLVGRRTRATAELSDQPINIPSDKTELELLTLKLYEENLALRAAREHLNDRLLGESDVSSLQDSGDHTPAVLRARTESSQTLRRQLDEARSQLLQMAEVTAQRDAEAVQRARCDDQNRELRTALAESLAKAAAKEAELATTRAENDRMQSRLVCLQNDLENIESVQADFVRLSQNLQMQLERLRQEETELRWVDPDYATECYACHLAISTTAKKINCRHCGKVHCAKCLKQFTSLTTPGRKAQPVCGVCYTLLNKHAAPYFSTGIKDNTQTHKESSPNR